MARRVDAWGESSDGRGSGTPRPGDVEPAPV